MEFSQRGVLVTDQMECVRAGHQVCGGVGKRKAVGGGHGCLKSRMEREPLASPGKHGFRQVESEDSQLRPALCDSQGQ